MDCFLTNPITGGGGIKRELVLLNTGVYSCIKIGSRTSCGKVILSLAGLLIYLDWMFTLLDGKFDCNYANMYLSLTILGMTIEVYFWIVLRGRKIFSSDSIFFYEGYVSEIVLFDGLLKFEHRLMSNVLSTILSILLGEFIWCIPDFYELFIVVTSFMLLRFLSKDMLTLQLFYVFR